jgi:arogenate dehydrogenase (NADP+)
MNSKKIGIVGLGLIGGSLGLDLYQKGHYIVGISRSQETCDRAMERKVCHQASPDFKLLNDVDLIFLCTPIGSIVPTLETISSELSPSTIVTDVASVKVEIVQKCSEIWPNFVGGHPMAGTAFVGIEAAQYNLFKNAPYVLTPIENTPSQSLECLKKIIAQLGSIPYITNPEEHDCAVAWISHLPVIVGATLLESIDSKAPSNILELAKKLASTGFKDTTRVGGGNPELGLMMAQYNREAILDSLIKYQQVLQEITDLIRQQKWNALEDILRKSQASRPYFLKD